METPQKFINEGNTLWSTDTMAYTSAIKKKNEKNYRYIQHSCISKHGDESQKTNITA